MFFRCFRFLLVFLIVWPGSSVLGNDIFSGTKNKADTIQNSNINNEAVTRLQPSNSENDKKDGENIKGADVNILDFKQIVPDPALTKDAKKVESAEALVHFPEKTPQIEQSSLLHNNIRSSDIGANSNKLLPISKTPVRIGSYWGFNNVSSGDPSDFTEALKGKIKGDIGEDAYAKIVWTYGEIQNIDDWINSTMAQYGFDDSYLFGGQKYSAMGLDDHVSMRVILQGNETVGESGLLPENTGKDSWKLREDNKAVLVGDYRRESIDNYAQNQKFAIVLKYFTIVNFVYLFFFVMFISLIIRGLKFLVRQQ